MCGVAAVVWVSAVTGYSYPQYELRYRIAAARLSAVERLPPAGKRAAVAGLYADTLPVFLADRSATRFDRCQGRCLELFRWYPVPVKWAVRADLRSGDRRQVGHAMRVLGELRWGEFFDDVVGILRGADRDLAGRAPYALRDLDDPRAIPLLLAEPDGHRKHMELLHHLCIGRPSPAWSGICLPPMPTPGGGQLTP